MSVRIVRTAGLILAVQTSGTPWRQRIDEALPMDQHRVEAGVPVDVRVRILHGYNAFDVSRLDPVTRGAWAADGVVVLNDACGSGVDLQLTTSSDQLTVLAQHNPRASQRALALAAPARATLLRRAVLVQYPPMWWAGLRGMAPLHVSALSIRGHGLVLAGPGGVGKSTLVDNAVTDGSVPTSDNLCLAEGHRLHGLLEPTRLKGAEGRRMPHGRRESSWTSRADHLDAEDVVVLRRGSGGVPAVSPLGMEDAVRAIVGGTYAAGELRRYWAFAATMALGTGLGPAHPPVEESARRLLHGSCARLLTLPAHVGTQLSRTLGLDAERTSTAGSS